MHNAFSFPPLVAPSARVLVLGSMPGIASLNASQYYAHPRNAFWPIMGELFGFSAGLPYTKRIQQLQARHVAVWDVLQSCVRHGSLDSAIERNTSVPNDLPGFLSEHVHIHHIFFNGSKAEECFRRHFALKQFPAALQLTRLPSTSPAHAGMSIATKLAAWRTVAIAASE